MNHAVHRFIFQSKAKSLCGNRWETLLESSSLCIIHLETPSHVTNLSKISSIQTCVINVSKRSSPSQMSSFQTLTENVFKQLLPVIIKQIAIDRRGGGWREKGRNEQGVINYVSCSSAIEILNQTSEARVPPNGWIWSGEVRGCK